MAVRGLKVGEVARRGGVTVRALHHYERIGLLLPSMRTGSGHRLYAPRDVDRLLRIVLLKGLGFPLEQISTCLEKRGFSLGPILQKHLAHLRRRMQDEMDLCRRVENILTQLADAKTVSADELFHILEMTHMIESYYTPEQLEALKNRRETIGEEKIKESEREWPELMRNMSAEMAAGTDPADPKVQALAKRWKDLVETFTGGDPGIAASLGNLWKERGPELAGKTQMGFDPKLFDYVRRAWTAGKP